MHRFRNSLLIVATSLVAAMCLLAVSDALAGPTTVSTKIPSVLATGDIGNTTMSGEPDVGGGSKKEPPPAQKTSYGPVIKPGGAIGGPGELRWILTIWARQFLGAGW